MLWCDHMIPYISIFKLDLNRFVLVTVFFFQFVILVLVMKYDQR